jgi:hypothetical protein
MMIFKLVKNRAYESSEDQRLFRLICWKHILLPRVSSPDNHPGGVILSETGQSIVLLALVFAVLLGFVALAVDVGFAFVRSSQFSAAVDAAALAGVVDLNPSTNDTAEADLRAEQFLATNGWPTATLTFMDSDRSLTAQGIPNYTLTVTWPVDFFFAKILGLSNYPITHSATGAFFAQAEIYTTSAIENGHVRKASQFIYGPDGCAERGDPVSPYKGTASTPNDDRASFEGVYKYRFVVTEVYTHSNILRIELFDPDSFNNQGNSTMVTHSISDGHPAESLACTSSGLGDKCIIDTGESRYALNQNPFWLQRVDENWNPDCTPNFADNLGDVITTYELYYFDDSGDRHDIAKYTVDNLRDYFNSDLKWVSPGAPGSLVPADSGSFEVDLSTIPLTPDGLQVIQMDVKASSGSAKNVWDVWAGPPSAYFSAHNIPPLSADVNTRNLQIANSPAAYNIKGVSTYALGRLPLTHYINNEEIKVPLAPIESTLGGGGIYATVFDFDTSVPPPDLFFTIDTVAESDFKMYSTVVVSPTEGHSGEQSDPLQVTCDNSTDCNNSWMSPQIAMGIPDEFFFGGKLEANYMPMKDDQVWALGVTAGRPFLTE